MDDNQMIVQSSEQERPINKLYKMRWYCFIIYFHLFVCSFLFLIMGIAILSTDYTQEVLFLVSDIILGALMICFSVYGIVVRHMLAHFWRHSVVCMQIFYSGYATIMLLQLIIDLSRGFSYGVLLSLIVIFLIFFNVLIAVINHFYFRKRKFLFSGSPVTYNSLVIETEENYKKEHPYVYGQYKGGDGWFAILIYFLLFANAAAFLALGILFIVLLSNGQIDISTRIGDYIVGLSMWIIDYKIAIVLTIVSLILAAFMIAVRFLLTSFKKAGVICLHCYFCINAVVTTALFIMEIVTSARIGENSVGFLTVVEWLYCILVTVGNFIYFKKRKDFFD